VSEAELMCGDVGLEGRRVGGDLVARAVRLGEAVVKGVRRRCLVSNLNFFLSFFCFQKTLV
jgi:hypothetical protein